MAKSRSPGQAEAGEREGMERKIDLLLKFHCHKTMGKKYVSRVRVSYGPIHFNSLRCRLATDIIPYTFIELNQKLSDKKFDGKFCFYLVNTENNMEEIWCGDLTKYCPQEEDKIEAKYIKDDISAKIKKLGY